MRDFAKKITKNQSSLKKDSHNTKQYHGLNVQFNPVQSQFFGTFGGQFAPETLMKCLSEIETVFLDSFFND
jgi:hypothetical protein